MRRWFLSVLVLAGLLLALDRIAVVAAQRQVARDVQAQEHLEVRPDVSIGGFPFLTQLVEGTYDDVTLVADGVRSGPLLVSRIEAHLAGVHLSLGEVLKQDASRIPIDRVRASVLLRYADLNRFLADRHLHIGPSDRDLPLRVEGGDVVIDFVAGVAVRIPLPHVPFGIHLDTVKAGRDGLLVTSSGADVVLER